MHNLQILHSVYNNVKGNSIYEKLDFAESCCSDS